MIQCGNMARKCEKYGKLISHGVRLYDHEKMTIEYFLMKGMYRMI